MRGGGLSGPQVPSQNARAALGDLQGAADVEAEERVQAEPVYAEAA